MDVHVPMDDQEEIWTQRRQRLEALMGIDPSPRRHNPAQPEKIMDSQLFSIAKEGDADKFIEALEDRCAKERVSLPVLLGLRSPSSNTLLHAAAESDDNVKALIDFVPEHLISCQNSRGETPLFIAARAGKTGAVELLLPRGKSKSRSVFSMSPVHVAIISKEKDMLTKMWEKKPWLFQLRDAGDGNPLHLAVYINYLDGVEFLMKKFPTSALEQDSIGYLPVHVACMMNHVKIVKELLRRWSDPAEFLTRMGQNILHVSARYGNNAIVTYILKNPKFDHLINARDFHGNTPLHLAASRYQPSVLLLARDGRVNLKPVNMKNMTALDVAEQNIKVFAPVRKRLTRIVLKSAGTPRRIELPICKPTGREPRKGLELEKSDIIKDHANTNMVVAALTASVSFTSGFSVPGGYNSSNPDAGIPILLHKAMYNVFVISNSIAMYCSIMTLVILHWTQLSGPNLNALTIWLSNLPLSVALVAMPLAFTAGVSVTVTELTWLSIFILVYGSFALCIILTPLLLMYTPLGFRCPLIRCFTDRLILALLIITRRETEGSGTAAGRADASVWGTHDDNLRPHLKRSVSI